MARLKLEVSDGLSELSALFVEYEHGMRVLDPEGARTIRQCLVKLWKSARRLENETSRLLWNEPELRRQLQEARILAEAHTPGTNLVLLPIGERPLA